MRDNILQGVKLRRKRNWLRGRLETTLGSRSTTCRAIVEDVKKYTSSHREKLKTKYKKKVEHLVKKFGIQKKVGLSSVMLEQMGNPRIFSEEIKPEEIKDPVVVEMVGEEIKLSEDETNALKLGPKFNLYVDLCDEEFETDVEEAILKVKWDLMGEDNTEEKGLEDIALEVLLGKEVCEEIDEQKAEEMEMKKAQERTPFNRQEMVFNYARRRVTDLKGNSRVCFPRKGRSLEVESALETLRLELRSLFSKYVGQKCNKGGRQEPNVSKSQFLGIKSLKKRVKEGEKW